MLTIRSNKQLGFSLIELLVAMTIMAILAVIIVPNLWTRVSLAKKVRVQQDIASINSALDIYKLDNDRYPTTQQGLTALTKKPTITPIPNNWNGPYLNNIPKDPWENKYVYSFPGTHNNKYDLYSKGDPNQEPRKKIGNWDTQS